MKVITWSASSSSDHRSKDSAPRSVMCSSRPCCSATRIGASIRSGVSQASGRRLASCTSGFDHWTQRSHWLNWSQLNFESVQLTSSLLFETAFCQICTKLRSTREPLLRVNQQPVLKLVLWLPYHPSIHFHCCPAADNSVRSFKLKPPNRAAAVAHDQTSRVIRSIPASICAAKLFENPAFLLTTTLIYKPVVSLPEKSEEWSKASK